MNMVIERHKQETNTTEREIDLPGLKAHSPVKCFPQTEPGREPACRSGSRREQSGFEIKPVV
jgi:hypothetical protein